MLATFQSAKVCPAIGPARLGCPLTSLDTGDSHSTDLARSFRHPGLPWARDEPRSSGGVARLTKGDSLWPGQLLLGVQVPFEVQSCSAWSFIRTSLGLLLSTREGPRALVAGTPGSEPRAATCSSQSSPRLERGAS